MTTRGYAWRVLRDGVCDGCALGTKGLHDWTISGTHLCNVRLRLLRLNTMGPLDPAALADVEPLRSMRGDQLRRLGRLPAPLRRRHGEPGFTPISWDEALDSIADRIRDSTPERLGFFLTSRGMCNESYYVAQKAARAIGTNSVDNAARICHSPSTFALKEAVGVAATTCSYSDWIGTDLVVFIGSNVANNQPVTTKYLHLAKKAGTKVAVVNPYREPGMERYWIPSTPESALFGTKISDRFFQINTGGDIGFLTGALKCLIERDLVNRAFIDSHTVGFAELSERAAAQSWEDLEAVAGTTREEMAAFARDARRGASAGCSSGAWAITQHTFGEDNVRAVANLGLARGWVGRGGHRPDADPRPLRRPGRRRDGLLRDGVPRRRRDQCRERRGAGGAVGLRRPLRARAGRAGDDRRGRSRRARPALRLRRELPRRPARAPMRWPRRSAASRCGCTWISCPPPRCSSTRPRAERS